MRKHSKNGINTRKLGSFLALLSFTAYMPVSCIPAFAEIGANVLPDLNKAVNGNVSKEGNNMNVAVQGGKGAVGQFDWNSFHVGKDARVNFEFSANSQTALNRVLGGGMSQIYGKLTQSSGVAGCAACANTGKVILINPNGVMFGPGSEVNLNSFTASTYDIKGAKNLRDLTTTEALNNYAGIRDAETGNVTGGLLKDIAGYNTSVQFVTDGLLSGNGYIQADGAKLYANKTLAMVSDKIDIKNSELTTTYNSIPNVENGTQTRSNIKLVTNDGVNFYYTSAGNVDNSSKTSYGAATTTNKTKGINIEDTTVRTGNLDIRNGYEGANSNVNIKNSTLYTKKLLGTNTGKYTAEQTGVNGNLSIQSVGKVNLTDSNIQTTNEEGNTTTGIGYGNMVIAAKGDVNIKNTQLRTADSKTNTDSSNIKAGNIKITSAAGDVNLVQDAPTTSSLYTNTAVAAAGDLNIAAAGDVNINGYNKIQAYGHGTANNASANQDRTINISANNVDINNVGLVNAKNLNIDSAKKINVKGSNAVVSNAKLLGTDTTLDNSLVQYDKLSFYDADSSKVNNVTLKGQDLALNDTTSDGLKITTNGNLTVDNSSLNKRAYKSTTVKDKKSVELESTTGNVTIQNNSNVKSNGGNIKIAANKNVEVNKSTVWAKNGNVDVNAKTGKVSAKGSTSAQSSIVAEGGSATIAQGQDMNLNQDFKNSLVGGTTKLTLKSNGSVIGENLVNGAENIGSYSNVSTLKDTANNARFTLSKNAEIVAKDNIALKGPSDLTLNNLTTDSGKGTTIAAAGKLDLNGLNIKNGPTTLEGKTVKTPSGKINANGNKVAINSPGDIDINISGASNPDNGLEINAKINTGIHNGNKYGQDELIGRNVKINAGGEDLAVSKIKADTLDLKAGKIVKGKTEITNEWDNLGYVDKNGVTHQEIADSTNSKGYIEVRTDGKFNLDPSNTYNDSNKGMYTGGNYSTTSTTTTQNVGDQYSKITDKDVQKEVTTDSELIGSKTVRGEEIGRSEASRTPSGEPKVTTERIDNVYQDGQEGYTTITTTTQEYDVVDDVTYKTITTDTYKDTETTTTKTTTTTTTYQDYKTTTNTRDKQHVATLNDSEKDGFVLVYGKNTSSSKTGSNVVDQKTDVKTDVKTIITNPGREVITTGTTKDKETRKDVKVNKNSVFCAYEAPVEPDVEVEDFSTWVKIPRHAEGVSNSAPVQNDLADTTATVVAAAARLQLDDAEDEDDTLE